MAKICTSCGAMNNDGATICTRCRKVLKTGVNGSGYHTNMGTGAMGGQQSRVHSQNNSYTPNNSQNIVKPNRNYIGAKPKTNTKSSLFKKKNNKVVGIAGAIAVIVALVIIIPLALNSGKPSENWLKENVPVELLTYEFGSEQYTSTVESIEVVRRNTEDGMDDAYCIVTLSDDMMKRTAYVEMLSTKYDQGGWVLESWNEYQLEEGTAQKGLDENYVYEKLSESGFTGLSGFTDNSDVASGIISYSYNVDEQDKYIDVSGTVILKGELKSNVEDGTGTPHKYYWEQELDVSGLTSKWNLDGDFELVDNKSISGKYFRISVSTKSNKIVWSAKYGTLDIIWGGDDDTVDHTAEGTAKIQDYHGPVEFASIEFDLMEGYDLIYTKDSVIMKNHTTAFASENILEKQ